MSQTGSVSDQQKILVMEQEISLQMEKLIPKMQEMANSYKLRNERSPFRNVLNVATDAASGIEETKNFIRYQLGRRGASQMWGDTSGGEKFAIALVDKIDGLRKDAKMVVAKMSERLETELECSWIRRVHLRLLQLYLGNLVRYQAYLSKE